MNDEIETRASRNLPLQDLPFVAVAGGAVYGTQLISTLIQASFELPAPATIDEIAEKAEMVGLRVGNRQTRRIKRM